MTLSLLAASLCFTTVYAQASAPRTVEAYYVAEEVLTDLPQSIQDQVIKENDAARAQAVRRATETLEDLCADPNRPSAPNPLQIVRVRDEAGPRGANGILHTVHVAGVCQAKGPR